MMRWLGQWVCSSWCRLVSQYLSFFCRCHSRRHQCVLRVSELRGMSCMALRRQLKFVVMGRWWKWPLIRVLIQYHLQPSVIKWILGDQCIYKQAFWFCRSRDRQFLYQWCSVLWLSSWRYFLFLSSIVLYRRVVCRFQFWLHRR